MIHQLFSVADAVSSRYRGQISNYRVSYRKSFGMIWWRIFPFREYPFFYAQTRAGKKRTIPDSMVSAAYPVQCILCRKNKGGTTSISSLTWINDPGQGFFCPHEISRCCKGMKAFSCRRNIMCQLVRYAAETEGKWKNVFIKRIKKQSVL